MQTDLASHQPPLRLKIVELSAASGLERDETDLFELVFLDFKTVAIL